MLKYAPTIAHCGLNRAKLPTEERQNDAIFLKNRQKRQVLNPIRWMAFSSSRIQLRKSRTQSRGIPINSRQLGGNLS